MNNKGKLKESDKQHFILYKNLFITFFLILHPFLYLFVYTINAGLYIERLLSNKQIKVTLENIKKLLDNKKLKQKLYIIIFESDTRAGKLFDVTLICCILLSVFIVIMESIEPVSRIFGRSFKVIEWGLTIFFSLEYILRIYCSPQPKKYIFSFFGIVDLLATLPAYLAIFFSGGHYFLVIRAFRLIRIFRIFKLFNFLKEGQILLKSIKMSSSKIIVFFLFVVILVISIGTIMYMIEGNLPNSRFNNIPNSIYWAVVTLTTVGYGDITPVTALGKFLSVCVMLLGYTIIAVPTGIVSVSLMKLSSKDRKLVCPHCHKEDHDEDADFCKYCGAQLNDKSPLLHS